MSAGQKPSSMTARQEKWFASILESMERLTGKTLDDWVAVAKTCPETKLGAWKAWFKETHGIGTNRASAILGQGVPRDGSLGRAGQLARYPLGGGGVIPGYRAVLPFDGQHYPENPSVEPA